MKVRSFWTDVPVPEHTTSDEVVTIPNDSSTIQELFERAARGDSLGGTYDEFEDDSLFDDVHDPDLQDPLLREANRLNTLENVQNVARSARSKKSKNKESVKDSPAPENGDTESDSGSSSADSSLKSS